MTDAEFAASLKVGDRWQSVVVGAWGLVARQHTVDRITEASVWIDGTRYSRRTGAGIPRPATPGQLQCARDDAERNTAARMLREHHWRAEPLETLRAVVALLARR